MKSLVATIAFLLVWTGTSPVSADVHSLRQRGTTLIEAEAYSAASEEYPYAEPCRKCSGQRNLGYFWKDSWFEIEVQVPQNATYAVSIRASSPTGTSVELLGSSDAGTPSVRLGFLQVPKTDDWGHYTVTQSTSVQLSAGTHTLRLKNLVDGTNVDYLTFSADPKESVDAYHPPKNAGPDKNPLKGFGSGWWRPADDYATVGFQYIEWGQLEPQDDQFDWNAVEEVLDRDGTRGRHLILQFVVDWDYREPLEANYVGPDWLLEKVGEHRGRANPNDPQSRPMRATKYNDPVYVDEAIEAIEALTDYFKDDPRIFVLQAGALGFWSEWHTFPRDDWSPNDETKRAIVKAYLKNLPPDGFTQIRYPDEPAIKPIHGIGYTNGSAVPTDHGYEFGQGIEQAQLWKNGPIAGEWPPNVELPFWRRFFLTDEGGRFIEQGRYSTLLMPEPKDIRSKLPQWTLQGQFESMHRRLGYNFQVDQVRHSVGQDGQVRVRLSMANIGIAPFYRNWKVQLGIIDGETSQPVDLVSLDTDIRKLEPDQSTVLDGIFRSPLNPSHRYQIGLRMIQPGADEAKPKPWSLDARNTYVVLANDVQVIPGVWDAKHSLSGGWNVIGQVDFRQ